MTEHSEELKSVYGDPYAVTIWLAGDIDSARAACRAFVDDIGLCVTVTATEFIYTGGSEPGVRVGLVNYPRFPSTPVAIFTKATALAKFLVECLGQDTALVDAPDRTLWLNGRYK